MIVHLGKNVMLDTDVYMAMQHLMQHVYNVAKENFNLRINLLVQTVQIGSNAVIMNTFHSMAIAQPIAFVC